MLSVTIKLGICISDANGILRYNMLIMYIGGDFVVEYEKSNVILMVQGAHRLFCYFNISSVIVKEFKDKYGKGSWENSKPVIKVCIIENSIVKEIRTILIDDFAEKWYIDMDRGDQDIFVKLGRVLSDDTFVTFAVSNTVTTPRNYESCDTAVYFVDVSQNASLNSQLALQNYKECTSNLNDYTEPKAYSFMSKKEGHNGYPKITLQARYYQNDFFIKHFEELRNKYNLNSSRGI